MNKQEAYKFFELEETAKTEEVNHNYEIFLKRAKFDESINVAEVMKYYDIIMAKPKPAATGKELKKLQKKNKRKQKFIIIAVVIMLFSALIGWYSISTIPANLRITFIGNFLVEDAYRGFNKEVKEELAIKKLESKMYNYYDVSKINADVKKVIDDFDVETNSFNNSVLMNVMVEANYIDILFSSNFVFYHILEKEDSLMELTPDILNEIGIDYEKYPLVLDSNNLVYGVDFTNCERILEIMDFEFPKTFGEQIIFSIGHDTANYEKTIEAIKYILR